MARASRVRDPSPISFFLCNRPPSAFLSCMRPAVVLSDFCLTPASCLLALSSPFFFRCVGSVCVVFVCVCI